MAAPRSFPLPDDPQSSGLSKLWRALRRKGVAREHEKEEEKRDSRCIDQAVEQSDDEEARERRGEVRRERMIAGVAERDAPERAGHEQREYDESCNPLIEEHGERDVLRVPRQVEAIARGEPVCKIVREVAIGDEASPTGPDNAHLVDLDDTVRRIDGERED